MGSSGVDDWAPGRCTPAECPPELPTAAIGQFGDVEVVIPCFNDGAVIRDAIASVMSQGVTQIMVVDDGSTDKGTLGELERLRGGGIEVVRQENGGPASARRTGLHLSTRPLVLFLDADDQIAPGALSAMADALRKDSSLAVVWGDVERFGSGGYLKYHKGRRLDPWRITFVNELVASTLVRREALLSVQGWSFDDLFEDWDLWMALAEAGWAGRHVGMVTLYYRVNDPRGYSRALKRYGDLVRRLQRRHPALFEQRKEHRKNSDSAWSLKVLWSLIAFVPLPENLRRYLFFGALVLCEPTQRRRRRP